MYCKLSKDEILGMVKHQISSNWGGYITSEINNNVINLALSRSEECYSKSKSKYFRNGNEIEFHIENSIQYSIFLYYLSNSLYKSGNMDSASYVYYLNKIMNSVELFYAVELPDHFGMEHPLGSVMGRAKYGDYFFFYQGCTVGGNGGFYPILGNNVTMYSNSKVLGNSSIGNNVIIGANVYIKDTDISDNSIVFGQYPNLIIKSGYEEKIGDTRNRIWR